MYGNIYTSKIRKIDINLKLLVKTKTIIVLKTELT